MNILANKVAIVTGASSGIGRASAKLFAAEGAKVIVTARRNLELEVLVKEIEDDGGQAAFFAGNINQESFSEALVNFTLDTYGRLDIAFNNAGILGKVEQSHRLSLESWLKTINTNLSGHFLAAKYQLRAMLENGAGSIMFTSSFVGFTVGLPQMAAYSASKAGLIGLTKALAAEYAESGIRVNALLPGGTDTPMGRESENSPEAIDFVKGIHALKRLATPEEIAQSALFLASEASSFTTGTALLADGGASICKV